MQKDKVIVVLATLCAVLAVLLVDDAVRGDGLHAWQLLREDLEGPGNVAGIGGPATNDGRADGADTAPRTVGADGRRGAPEGVRDLDREARIVARSVAGSGGVWDSHPDADVGRVLQPGLESARQLGYEDVPITSNRFGMRERNYVLPKPPGTVRVVLLGDSFIFGQGVPAEDRLGAKLEERLRAAAPAGTEVEVLHLGAASWNILAETSYLRRQLSLLAPDLVVHVTVPNDLDDTAGVRGTGLLARHAPRWPSHADSVVHQLFAHWALAKGAYGHLPRGVDDEGRRRLAAAAGEIERLADAVERCGGRYLHVFHWRLLNPVAREHLASVLRPEQVSWLPLTFYLDARVRLAKGDDHWSTEGHRAMARYLYGVIQGRGLLAPFALPPWDDASRTALALGEAGRREAESPEKRAAVRAAVEAGPALDLARLDATSAAQVHAGVHADGDVAPYASALLAPGGGTELHLVGRCLERPELDGARVSVSVDGVELGAFEVTSGAPLDLRWPLPVAAREADLVTVRLASDDYVYDLPVLRECVVFRLERLAVE